LAKEEMKIFYIVPLESIHAERWMRYFADAGHDIHLITSDKPSQIIKNVKVNPLKRFGPHFPIISHLVNSIAKEFQFRKLIRTLKPDIIHAHYIMRATLLGAVSGFHPFVVTVWGSDILIAPKESKISRYIAKYVLRKADLITCDAEHIKKPLVELGANPQKIKIIYFGTDTRKFSPGKRDNKLREKLGILDSPAIISLRNLQPLYDIKSLIIAIPQVLKKIPTAKFIIAGKGSEETKLKALAKSLKILESIRFVGWIPNNELPQYIASADIYVSTSLSDAGLAASTAEAMASELPVIITDFGDNRKWVKDGINGFIIPLRDPEVLAQKIIYLLQNESERKKLGKANRQIIEEKNNWEKEMGKMEKLYQELIKKHKSGNTKCNN